MIAETDLAHELRFGSEDIERWADFSGDRNPIHFDLDQARKIGVDALVVHGMLAMLPIKRTVTDQAPPGGAQWTRYRALFRFPVLQDMPLLLTLRAGGEGMRFKASGSGGQDCIRGSYGPAEEPDPPALDAEADLAERPLNMLDFSRFRSAFGTSADPWIVLDAVVFADFMRTRIDEVKAVVRPRTEPLFGAAPDDVIIVHATHTVTFDRRRCAAIAASMPSPPPLTYSVSDPLVMTSGEQVVCTMNLPVKAGNRPIMTVELGLILRKPGAE